MNQCQYQVISKTNSMTGKKRGRIQGFKLRKGVQNVACDSFISAVPNSTCSLDSFILTVTSPTRFPEPLYLRNPTQSSDFITPLLHFRHSHSTCSPTSWRPLNFDPSIFSQSSSSTIPPTNSRPWLTDESLLPCS